MFRLVIVPVIARVKKVQTTFNMAKKAWGFLRGLWVLWCSCQGLLKLGLRSSQYLQRLQGPARRRRDIGMVAKVAPVVAQAWGTRDGKWGDVVGAGLGCL